ncbi:MULTISPECIES: ion channel [Chryseobacterium]|jgi:inward rectifier potassium channel|uniref:Inward rectifier potassium channel Irk n=1 Tax=Chryseobacterium rhizosphaerae TaxID=395937 RepID=A0ABX9IQV4_9FLAO|nr:MULTISPECIES: ion channel [Chryseobacterium]MBL3549829.1 Inward rectifier potassium channel Irk [Chryseobacterium sp. KMC2]MDC8102296.1 ion channel [Chryseobacterium rhizosphaerae]MDR6544641.1 inward rectifier potassium channel [Chryseobacterium rhizosphaerae]REC78374.1 Inward rectifier potassium channel Irk [Chryseobacterium rhizosphaerae]SMC74322.1 inward rectifier potassium channel [Chryseobacterium sp. YR221]
MTRGFRKKIRQKNTENSGFGSNASGRFINKDGLPNVQRTGVNVFNRLSWYHTMLNLSSFRFISYLVVAYILINLVFAMIYYIIGVEHLTGIDKSDPLNEFIDVFFFSSQTFTTVGYGRIAPVGFMASLVATFEAFLGLLTFAIATGLFYGRFSRPRAYLRFSDIAVIAPFQDAAALMFRLAPYKNNALTDADVIVSAAIEVIENGVPKSNFYRLETHLSKINTLALNWTVVHKIDENSPFYGFSEEDFNATDIELIVQVRAFDEVFSNTVVQRSSYVTGEIIYGARFVPMYYPNKDNQTTILDLDKINEYQKEELTASVRNKE